ncbi:MAG: chemotaxis protein CheW [Clostridia bacterium]|nr:chemotaxis protein CheW [Deltaproteobacteria bacterium]
MTDLPHRELGGDPDNAAFSEREADDQQFFVFRIGQTLLAARPVNIDRVLPRVRPVRIPTAPSHVLGILHLQGRIITVVNLRAVLISGAPLPPRAVDARTLVLRATGGLFATDVDQVLGLLATHSTRLRPPERTETNLQSAVYEAEYEAGEGLVTVLAIDRLFEEMSRG